MSIIDSFRPKWKHSNKDIRLKAVIDLDDPKKLKLVASTDDNEAVRRTALKKIKDQDIIKDVINNSDEKIGITAIEFITDQDFIIDYLQKRCLDTYQLKRIFKLIKNEQLLIDILMNDNRKQILLVALEMITDSNIIHNIVLNTENDVIRNVAVDKIEDQDLLIDIAKKIDVLETAQFSINKIIRNTLQARCKDDSISKVRYNLVNKNNLLPVYKEVVCNQMRLQYNNMIEEMYNEHQSIFYDIALNANNNSISCYAIEGISDQKKLFEIATLSNHENIALKAVDIIICESTLSDVIKCTKNNTVKQYALRRLNKYKLIECNIHTRNVFDSVKDYDGNIYKTIKIGNQVWLAENLQATHLSDGTEIPYIKDKYKWTAISQKGYCILDHEEQNTKQYGFLYNEFVTYYKFIEGWHVPNFLEWNALLINLGVPQHRSNPAWADIEKGAGIIQKLCSEDIGFNALSAGYYNSETFLNRGTGTAFWINNINAVETINMDFKSSQIRFISPKGFQLPYTRFGCSIRLIKNKKS